MRVTDVRWLHDVLVTDMRWLHGVRVTDVGWLHGVRVTDVGWLHDVRVTDVGWLHGVQVKHRQQHIKMLLESKKIPFEEVDISCSHDLLDKMREIAGNPKCLPPQIARGDEYIGVSGSVCVCVCVFLCVVCVCVWGERGEGAVHDY